MRSAFQGLSFRRDIMGIIVLIIYLTGAVLLPALALALPNQRFLLVIAALVWAAIGGGYLLYRRLRAEERKLATLLRVYLRHLETMHEEQNSGRQAERLLGDLAAFCSKELGFEQVALFGRRRSGFVVINTQGLERRSLSRVRLKCKDDLIVKAEEEQSVLDLTRFYQSVRWDNPFGQADLKYLLPVISGKMATYFLLLTEPRHYSLRLLRPFLLALADQLGVYNKQEESRNRLNLATGKIKNQLEATEVELKQGNSNHELLSRVILEAQSRLTGVQNRDQLYTSAADLLKASFGAKLIAICQAKPDSDTYECLKQQGLNRKRTEAKKFEVDTRLVQHLTENDGWAQLQSLRKSFGKSPLVTNLAGLGFQVVALLEGPKPGGTLLAVGRGGKGFSDEEARAIGSLSKLLNLVLANLGHLEKIEEMSYTDSMTNLYNYRYFYKRLKEEILRAQRFSRELSLVIFDIDEFKVFNDTHGHQAGDHLLRQLGKLLTESVRTVDIVSRYGGEEFCIIMPETGPDDCRTFMERLPRKILDNRFRNKFSNEQQRITVSLGGAIYPNDAQRVDRLIYCADMALLKAKASGRNKSCMYEKSLTEDKQPS